VTEAHVRDWIRRFAAAVTEHREELVRLDSAIGDGDHGTNLDRGMAKAVEKLDAVTPGDIGADLKAVGMALVSSVGRRCRTAVRRPVPADGHGDGREGGARAR
jgi:dihydroxyacetone kinase-like protein